MISLEPLARRNSDRINFLPTPGKDNKIRASKRGSIAPKISRNGCPKK